VTIGVGGELVTEFFASNVDRQLASDNAKLVGGLGEVAEKALDDSNAAVTQAETAVTKAGLAEDASGRAVGKSSRAEGTASMAMTLASGARQEADTFEKRLGSAEHKADEAESHLAEALRRAIEATAALDKIRLPRSLTNIPDLVSVLGDFKDTEYAFTSVFQDGESIELLKSIDTVLQDAGWKKVKPPPGFPAINIYGKEDGNAVPVGFNQGIDIVVDSPEATESLLLQPIEQLPVLVRAAMTLRVELLSNLSPQANDTDVPTVRIQKGESKTVRIAVGKKP